MRVGELLGREAFYLIFYGIQLLAFEFCCEEFGYFQAIPKSCVIFLFIAKTPDQG